MKRAYRERARAMSVVPCIRARPSGKRVMVCGRAVEAKEEVVETDGAMGLEAVAHGGEVDWAVVLVDLDGVASAEGDMRAAFAGQVDEDALAADGAVWVGGAGIDFAALVGPEIVAEEGAADEVRLVGEELEGFGGLDGGGQVDGGGEDAGGVAGFDGAGGGLGKMQARQAVEMVAGCLLLVRWLGADVHCGGVGAYGCGVDPGL